MLVAGSPRGESGVDMAIVEEVDWLIASLLLLYQLYMYQLLYQLYQLLYQLY